MEGEIKMGLFDDDFYSTKVTKQHKDDPNKGKKWSRGNRGRKGSKFQVSLITAILSVMATVLIFSVFPRLQPSPLASGWSLFGGGSTDPFERISQTAAQVSPAVVSILNHNGLTDDGEKVALGSGVIFKKENGKAYIMTNNHVISSADQLEVVLSNGKSKQAKVVGQDQISDIAVLSIEDSGVKSVIKIGDSNKVKLGETVIAIGNPLGLGGTLTSGLVSYTDRMIPVSLNQDGIYDWEQEMIQTNAAINEGNSGGALVDLNGTLIGINTMKISDTGVEGLGFAIPVNEAMEVVNDLMTHGKVVRPYLGVYTLDLDNPYSDLTSDQRKELKLPNDVKDGALVLEAHGPAKKAGLQLNDVIVALDDTPIHSTRELRKYLFDHKQVGDIMEVSYYRNGEKLKTKVDLTDKPSDTEIEEGLEDGQQ